MDEDKQYYQAIHDRGWATWIHGLKDGFRPIVRPGWKKRTQVVSNDRQVTVTYDPSRFTEQISDEHEMVEVYRNSDYKVVLFSVGS